MPTHDADTYEVGYGKPPKRSQFKKGQSGNPRGRPKGSRNITTLLEEALFRKVSIKDERGARKITFAEALMQKVTVDALKGDPRALAKVIDLMKFYDARNQAPSDDVAGSSDTASFKLTDGDIEVMRYIARELAVAGDNVGEDQS